MERIRSISAKAARINANIGTQEAAEKLGISRVSLYNYEVGRSSPPWEIVERMSKLYDYPIGNISFAKQSTKSAAR